MIVIEFNWWLISLFILVLAVLTVFFYMQWFFRGAPFDTTSKKKVKKMIQLAKIKKGDKAVDLGSGDGRLVIEMAKKGAEAHGYEINPLLVWLSRCNIKKAGLKGKAFIHWKNFWNVNLKKFNIIMIFQFCTVMPKLEKKLKKELKPKSKIVSNHWKFPNWKPKKKSQDVLLYVKY